jgi:hypothetical protein
LQGLVEEMPEPAMESFIEQPISEIPQIPIDLPKRHVEIYETDINFYNIPTNVELETHLAQQTYRQPVLPRTPSTRSPINSNQTTPSRDRSSMQTRKVTAKPFPKVSSTRRSSRPNRQLSPLQKVSKAAIELAEMLESILVWVWRSWFLKKRQKVTASNKYKRPPNFR